MIIYIYIHIYICGGPTVALSWAFWTLIRTSRSLEMMHPRRAIEGSKRAHQGKYEHSVRIWWLATLGTSVTQSIQFPTDHCWRGVQEDRKTKQGNPAELKWVALQYNKTYFGSIGTDTSGSGWTGSFIKLCACVRVFVFVRACVCVWERGGCSAKSQQPPSSYCLGDRIPAPFYLPLFFPPCSPVSPHFAWKWQSKRILPSSGAEPGYCSLGANFDSRQNWRHGLRF